MKKHLFLLALATGLTFSLSAQADFYAGIGGGMSFNGGSASKAGVRSEYKDSTIYSFAGGYQLPLPLLDVRGEIEYLRLRPEVKDGRTKQLDGAFLNAYGFIPLFPLVDPYVGLGVGKVRYDHSNSFAVQGMLGLEYSLPFLPDLSVGAEYRYLKVNETTGKAADPSKFHTNVLMLKARYMF